MSPIVRANVEHLGWCLTEASESSPARLGRGCLGASHFQVRPTGRVKSPGIGRLLTVSWKFGCQRAQKRMICAQPSGAIRLAPVDRNRQGAARSCRDAEQHHRLVSW
jgi:hypothetical protein